MTDAHRASEEKFKSALLLAWSLLERYNVPGIARDGLHTGDLEDINKIRGTLGLPQVRFP